MATHKKACFTTHLQLVGEEGEAGQKYKHEVLLKIRNQEEKAHCRQHEGVLLLQPKDKFIYSINKVTWGCSQC